MKPVSPATERALFDAMERLLGNCPHVSDGKLTIVNLAIEAGVSRATANRAPKVLAFFRQAVAASQARETASGQKAAADGVKDFCAPSKTCMPNITKSALYWRRKTIRQVDCSDKRQRFHPQPEKQRSKP